MAEEDASGIDRLGAIADALAIGRLQRHLFICAEQTTPRCAGYE